MATMYCNWDGYDYEWEHVIDDFGHDNDNNEPGFIELKRDIVDYLKNTEEGRKRLLDMTKEMKCEPSDLEDDEVVENAMNDILDCEIKYHTIDDDYDYGYDAFELANMLMQQGYKDMNSKDDK